MSKFDLSRPETLLLPPHIDDSISMMMDVELFRYILHHGYQMKLSDFSFQEGVPIMIKINNLVFPVSRRPLNRSTIQRIISILHNATEGDDSAYQNIMHGEPANSTYTFKMKDPDSGKRFGIRYRFNVIRDQEISVCVTMRLNNDEILDLSAIGQSENGEIYQNMFPMKGLNLITGAVDSGKTTLMYACLGHFVRYSPRSAFIHTYEKPIEADLKAFAKKHGVLNKVIGQTPVPGGCANFSEGIENSLRRNTDIILIGEIRTKHEVESVVTGVNITGKLLMGTLHTDSAPMTIDRLIHTLQSENEGETRAKIYDLLSALNMIVSQKLLSTVDKKRVAVYELLTFDKSLKKHLQSLEPQNLTRELENIMIENGKTMVHMAHEYLLQGRISKEVFTDFKSSFSYGGPL